MKTVKFFKMGNGVRVIDYDDSQVVDKIEPAVYTICQDMTGFYLNFVSNNFDVPDKIYGSTEERVSKILKTYDDRSKSTGVLMSGDKGSGKTMLSSLLCNKMIDRGLPTILVERPYQGIGFVDFINNIGECTLMFDEFAKVFAKEDENSQENNNQSGLLSVFDGAHTIKRLILLTENETYNINSYMLNRPGRIFYHFKYSKLEEDLVEEYCKANKVPEEVVQAILFRIDSSREFSFDALKAVVEEYGRFGGDIQDIFTDLNIEEPRAYSPKMKVVKIINTKTNEELESLSREVNQVTGSTELRYKSGKKRPNGNDIEGVVWIGVKDLIERTSIRQVYNIEECNLLVVLEKQQEETYPAYGSFLDV